MELLDGKYKIKRELGRGGFGTVSLAIDQLTQRRVAIKVLNERETSSQKLIIKEIQAIAQLKHPNIITFYHHFIQDSMLNLVMEYGVGGSLDEFINLEKYEYDEAIEICIMLTDALDYIHNHGIIHRDIKPSNILFDENHTPKISDFGVANSMGGTFIYLPPEIFFSEYKTANNPQIDIYALGIVLLEMIKGINPFSNISRNNIITSKLNHSFIPNDLPYWIQEIIIKATHPSPNIRFQSALDFSSALRAKCVPYAVNKENIKADRLFSYSQKSLSQRKWNKSRSYFDEAFKLSPDSVLGHITAGKYYLRTYNLNLAKVHFEKALKINPGVSIKKELSEIHIDEGNYPHAISLLQSHLQLNPIDWEAYNLIIECYYRMGRFDLALEILDSILSNAKQSCFWNNYVIIHLNNGTINESIISKAMEKSSSKYFISFNLAVYTDRSKSWSDKSSMINKFLFQPYRFSCLLKENQIIIESSNNSEDFSYPIISVGRNKENDFIINKSSVSRRHCVIINYDKDVWIYDLGSSTGIYVDDKKITSKYFLLGKHKISIGDYSFYLYTSKDVLL